jgi:hypothetical protein
MQHKSRAIIATLCLVTASVGASSGRLAAQTTPHLVPASIQNAQKETLEQLGLLAAKPGPVGTSAGKVLVLLRQHTARENEFILPPLTLLPYLADGKVTPDMAWALPMVDRVKAEREQIFNEHAEITEALNGLIVAATAANDQDAKEFAESAAADSLADLEILEPTILLIGDTLRSKLPAPH